MQTPLSPTPRSTPKRHADRALTDRQALYAALDEALVCHLGVVVDGEPLVVPTAFGYDRAGSDEGGTLYLHGSVASRSLRQSENSQICVTVTLLDGLVLARSGFHHSMNYRSVVVRGRARAVSDHEERRRALDLIVDHAVPGRSATLREPLPKELAATTVVALPLHEASVKTRTGPPLDDDDDVSTGAWAGAVALAPAVRGVQADRYADGVVEVPSHVQARVAQLAGASTRFVDTVLTGDESR